MDMNYVKLHELFNRQIKDLLNRVEQLEKDLYNTTSTISQNTIDIDMDRDYGQQSI